jgi:hypothetical protein
MGTRGLFGFRYKGRYYLMYNQYDSYYGCLGVKILKEIKKAIKKGKFNKWIEKFKNIIIINEDKNSYIKTNTDYPICDRNNYSDEDTDNEEDKQEIKENEEEYYDINKIKIIEREPNSDDIDKLLKYSDFNVSKQSSADWYCLTRKIQGSIKKILKSGYLLLYSQTENLTGNIFIEYSYVLDFDSITLVVYTAHGYVKTINLLDIQQIDNTLKEW